MRCAAEPVPAVHMGCEAVEGYDLVQDQSTTEGEATVVAGEDVTVELKDVYEETPEVRLIRYNL